MTHNQAKRRLQASEDFLLFCREGEMINIVYRHPDSWDVVLTALVNSPELRQVFQNLIDEANSPDFQPEE